MATGSSVDFKKVCQGQHIKTTDMPAEQAMEVAEIITAEIDKVITSLNFEKAAQVIKDNLDKRYGPTWHVCIGEGFGFEVTHESRQLIYLQHQEKFGVVAFKC